MSIGRDLAKEQHLQAWMAGDYDGKGEAAHLNGDCCPDFACCYPENAANPYERQRFVDCTEVERQGMLVGFLVTALERHYGLGSVTTSADVEDDEGEEWKGVDQS